jgi:integrase
VEIPVSDAFLALLEKQVLLAGASHYVAPKMAFMYDVVDRHKTLSMQFIRIAEKARAHGKSFHCYRHAFVSRMLTAGVSAEMVSTMTGQTLKQVMEYLHVSLEDKHAFLRRIQNQTTPIAVAQ